MKLLMARLTERQEEEQRAKAGLKSKRKKLNGVSNQIIRFTSL